MRISPHGFTIVATILLVTLAAGRGAEGAIIYVTTTQQKVTSANGCSLEEAIYSANLQSNIAIKGVNPDGTLVFITTQCVPGTGNDRIILPSGALFQMNHVEIKLVKR